MRRKAGARLDASNHFSESRFGLLEQPSQASHFSLLSVPLHIASRRSDDHAMTLVQTDVSHTQQVDNRRSRLIRTLIALPIAHTHSGYRDAGHKRVWTLLFLTDHDQNLRKRFSIRQDLTP